MARIRALVGECDNKGRALVGSPALLDTHTPDAFQVVPSIQNANDSAPNIGLSIALHVFRPPIAARVSKSGNTPCALSFGGIPGKVLHSAGPWRRSGNWWESEAQWIREEWEVAVQYEGGVGVFRIYLDLSSNHWFVEALYD
jgi:protein ImuB